MLFQFTDVERGRLEDLLYELRYAGYQVDLHYSADDATVDGIKDETTVRVRFSRPSGTKLYIDGQIVPEGDRQAAIIVTRITPVITYVRQTFREQQLLDNAKEGLDRRFQQ